MIVLMHIWDVSLLHVQVEGLSMCTDCQMLSKQHVALFMVCYLCSYKMLLTLSFCLYVKPFKIVSYNLWILLCCFSLSFFLCIVHTCTAAFYMNTKRKPISNHAIHLTSVSECSISADSVNEGVVIASSSVGTPASGKKCHLSV